MRKLNAVGLILCIITVLVSGAGAVPEKDNSFHGSGSLSEYTYASATPSSDGSSSVASTAYVSAGVDQQGRVFLRGFTQNLASGGSGTYAVSGSTTGGTLITK